MPSIYTRQAIFSSSSSSGQYRVTGSSTASIKSSSGSRYSARRGSGRSSITSSQRSNDWQDSVRSNISIPRNSRTYNLLSTPRMSFGEGNTTTTTPVPFPSTRDNSNDWGYFVDCDDHVEELPMLTPMVLDHYRGTTTIPEILQDGFILEL